MDTYYIVLNLKQMKIFTDLDNFFFNKMTVCIRRQFIFVSKDIIILNSDRTYYFIVTIFYNCSNHLFFYYYYYLRWKIFNRYKFSALHWDVSGTFYHLHQFKYFTSGWLHINGWPYSLYDLHSDKTMLWYTKHILCPFKKIRIT